MSHESVMRLFTNPEWMRDAPCVGRTDDFYPEQYQNATVAKAICAECPHKVRCLECAIDNAEEHGVWGGTTRTERQKIVARRRDMGWTIGAHRDVGAHRKGAA